MRSIAIIAIVAATVDAHAEPTEVEVTAHLGFTEATFEAPALSEAKGHGFIFLVEGSYEPLPNYVASVRIPAVLVSVSQPAGAYTDRTVLGNPQLRVARRVLERAMAGLELGVPLAGHGDDLLDNRALAIADAIEGRGAPELFTPGVLPATMFGELSFGDRPWRFDVSVRLPWLLRTSDADMPSSTSNAVGLAAVLSAQAQRRMTRRLTAGIATQLVADIARVREPVRDRGRLQDLERLHLTIGLGRSTELTVAFQMAIGGELGGSTFGGGLGVVSTL